ncbi:hypothetical protein AXF42_Ash013874 [Apostasia shenzhenica]|uniref:Uncharacterized protein n=1 Tax=Apostasia shenzhenica TaxID=1088818 RepID=A0A2I0AS43_9ASPA|nr:hypothetical protein AXF42_Ash013874 [Apostasia shenzhenica]
MITRLIGYRSKMSTRLAVSLRKENLQIADGLPGKGVAEKKFEMGKVANVRGKGRKALAELSTNMRRASGESNGLTLKRKKAENDKRDVTWDASLTDEEVRQCKEWAKDGIELMGRSSWTTEDENLELQRLKERMPSWCGGISHLESPMTIGWDEKVPRAFHGLYSPPSSTGKFSPVFTVEELEDPFAEGCELPELEGGHGVAELKKGEDDNNTKDVNCHRC